MKKLIFLCLFSIVMFSANLQAQVFYAPIEKLAEGAFDIVEGRVTNIEYRWDERHRIIHSFIIVDVNKSHKNTIVSEVITIDEIGGMIDSLATWTSSMPVYKENEDILVFLKPKNNNYRTYGLDQGKFTLNNINGDKTVERQLDLDEISVFGPALIKVR